MLLKGHPTHHSFSNYGMCTTSGMPTTVYWYMTLIENKIIKKDTNYKNTLIHKAHIFANMQYC